MYHNAQRYSRYEVVVTTTAGGRSVRRVTAVCHNSLDSINYSATSARENYKRKSCYTGAVARLARGDVVSVQNMQNGSLVSAVSQDTFIGFIKLNSGH